MKRKPRNANRGTTQAIHDQFMDLSLAEQEAMLSDLAIIHRLCKRERSRKPDSPVTPPPSDEAARQSGPQTGDEAEAAGRAWHEQVTGSSARRLTAQELADPGKNAALDLPEEPKQ